MEVSCCAMRLGMSSPARLMHDAQLKDRSSRAGGQRQRHTSDYLWSLEIFVGMDIAGRDGGVKSESQQQ